MLKTRPERIFFPFTLRRDGTDRVRWVLITCRNSRFPVRLAVTSRFSGALLTLTIFLPVCLR